MQTTANVDYWGAVRPCATLLVLKTYERHAEIIIANQKIWDNNVERGENEMK